MKNCYLFLATGFEEIEATTTIDILRRAGLNLITYLRTLNGFVYLFLITDLYSRKIVGWSLSRSLAIEGAIETLRMALGSRKDKGQPLTHHSDRGIQYCSTDYVRMLQKANVQISMKIGRAHV